MKHLALPYTCVAAALLVVTLAACGTWPGQEPAAAHDAPNPIGGPRRGPGASAGGSGAEGSGTGSGRADEGSGTGAGTAYGRGRVFEHGAGRLAMGDLTGDLQAMCELHRRMMVAPTPEARQAATDKYMGTMSPETRHHLLLMMREQCG